MLAGIAHSTKRVLDAAAPGKHPESQWVTQEVTLQPNKRYANLNFQLPTAVQYVRQLIIAPKFQVDPETKTQSPVGITVGFNDSRNVVHHSMTVQDDLNALNDLNNLVNVGLAISNSPTPRIDYLPVELPIVDAKVEALLRKPDRTATELRTQEVYTLLLEVMYEVPPYLYIP